MPLRREREQYMVSRHYARQAAWAGGDPVDRRRVSGSAGSSSSFMPELLCRIRPGTSNVEFRSGIRSEIPRYPDNSRVLYYCACSTIVPTLYQFRGRFCYASRSYNAGRYLLLLQCRAINHGCFATLPPPSTPTLLMPTVIPAECRVPCPVKRSAEFSLESQN